MLNLQLGIRWSVSRNARDPALKELPSSVFSEKVRQPCNCTARMQFQEEKKYRYCQALHVEKLEVFSSFPSHDLLAYSCMPCSRSSRNIL